jgi:acetyl esterase/lipase
VVNDVRVDTSPVGPVLRPPEPSDAVILYLHGDPSEASTAAAGALALRTGATVVCPTYGPSFPAAFSDVLAGYHYAKREGPVSVVGERMGAGLAAALLVHLRDLGTALPRCAVLVSALLDLTMRANSVLLNARADPAWDITRLRQRVADYAGGAVLTDPLLSPLYANLHGLAPLQLLVAGTDPLLDDSLAFATRAARSRVTVDLRVYPDAATLTAETLAATSAFLAARNPAPIPVPSP